MSRIIEIIKTALIVCLSLLMVLLLVGSFVVTVTSEALSPGDLWYEFISLGEENKDPAVGESMFSSAVFPCQIAFLQEGGRLYMPCGAEAYSLSLDESYQLFEEALGSAISYKEATEEEYLAILLTPGIMYHFDYPVSFSMLCTWAEGGFSGESIAVESMILSSMGENARLIIRDADGKTYDFDTLSDGEHLRQLCNEKSPNGIISAAKENSKSASDSIILDGGAELLSYKLSYSAYDSSGELPGAVMSAFSINPYLSSVYRDGETIVYIEGENTLRVYPDGRLSFSASTGSSGEKGGAGEDEKRLRAIESARKIVFPLWSELCSDTILLSMSEVVKTDSGYTVFFEAYIGGCFVSAGDHAAAAVSVKDGKITEASIYPMQLEAEERVTLFPYAQAETIISDGSHIAVVYTLEEGVLVPKVAEHKLQDTSEDLRGEGN